MSLIYQEFLSLVLEEAVVMMKVQKLVVLVVDEVVVLSLASAEQAWMASPSMAFLFCFQQGQQLTLMPVQSDHSVFRLRTTVSEFLQCYLCPLFPMQF